MHVAWMIYEYFKVSDTDEAVSDNKEVFKVELKNANERSFNTRWGETMIAMKKQTDEEILATLWPSASKSEQLEPLSSLYIQDIVQTGESRDYTRPKQMVVRYPELNTRENHFSSHEKQIWKARLWRCCSQKQVQGQRQEQNLRLRTLDDERSMLPKRNVWNGTRPCQNIRESTIKETDSRSTFKEGTP